MTISPGKGKYFWLGYNGNAVGNSLNWESLSDSKGNSVSSLYSSYRIVPIPAHPPLSIHTC